MGNKVSMIFLILIQGIFSLTGCRTAYTDKQDVVYNARERDIFDRYKTITEKKYQNEILYLKDVLMVDYQRNGFQPFAFRTLDLERFTNTVYHSLTELGIKVEKHPEGTNIFDIDSFYVFREESSKNMEKFVNEFITGFETDHKYIVLPCIEFSIQGSYKKDGDFRLFYSTFYMHFYIYVFDNQRKVIYKNQRSMLTDELGKYSEDFRWSEALDIESFERKLGILVEDSIKEFIE